jgi:hypothetical protein
VETSALYRLGWFLPCDLCVNLFDLYVKFVI